MNNRQRTILIVVAALIGLMLLYPPFQIKGLGLGYSWIFSPPTDTATINAVQLLVQWVAVALIGGIAHFLSKGSQATISNITKSPAVVSIPADNPQSNQSNADQFSANPLYEAIIGEKNRDRYLAKFAVFDRQPGKLTASWNWSAFLFAGTWALYRKMYSWFFALWSLAAIAHIIAKAGLPRFSALAFLASLVAFGIYADAIYYRRAKAKITEASHFNEPAARLDYLRKKGGVHTWVLWVLAFMIIAIIASIVIPMLSSH